MSSNYIYALAQRHASIERKIEEAMKAPLPDTLYLMELKRLRLACREKIRDAIRKKRAGSDQTRRRQWTMPPHTLPASQPGCEPAEGR